jgi:hypothetical protein
VELIRLEHIETGMGPYHSDLNNIEYHTKSWEISERHRGDDYPNGKDDDVINKFLDTPNRNVRSTKYFFGFNNLEQFNKAFLTNELIEFINQMNYKVYKITLKPNKGCRSQYQTIFKKKDVLDKTDLSYLFI